MHFGRDLTIGDGHLRFARRDGLSLGRGRLGVHTFRAVTETLGCRGCFVYTGAPSPRSVCVSR